MSWTHTVEAFNTATDSMNKIHDDAVARQFGFRGGLVPGVDVWAYLVHPCVDRWGDDFLTSGHLEARFAQPTYDGEQATATLGEDGSLTVTDPEGTECATGSAGIYAGSVAVPDVDAGTPPPFDQRPPASAASLEVGSTLGSIEFTFDAAKSAAYLGDIRETDPRYLERGISHPGFLARLCNTVLSRNVVLGPWIHVGTDAHHLGVLTDGDPAEVRARVTDEREHKGHRFVDLDVVILGRGEPIYSAFHTAIWQPRSVASSA